MRFIHTPAVLAGLTALPQALSFPGPPHIGFNLDAAQYGQDNIVSVDVAIIGGGSVGTYSAFQLKDAGKKVLVIEKKGRLGGHTETFTDPETGSPIDIGVKLYYNDPIVYNYYKRFNLTTSNINISGGPAPQYIDFRTGKDLQGVPPSNSSALAAALGRYSAVLAKYPQLERGFFLPDPVPEELTMPFGQFVEKYDLGALVQFFFNIAGAFGDILELPTVQQFRAQSLELLATVQDFQTSSVMNNSLLYGRAEAELSASKSLFLNSNVLCTERVSKSGSVKLLVDTPQGRKLVVAKKLLITIPPTPAALKNFDINKEEFDIFSQLKGVGYYTSVIRNAAPPNVQLQNLALTEPYALPPMPGFYTCNPSGVNPALHVCYYGTKLDQILSDDDARAAIIASLKQYQAANGVNLTGPPEFEVFSNHSPYYLMASAEATKEGFYKDMYALQGKRNTFWNGATWRTQDSTACWKFTKDVVVPQVLAGLGAGDVGV
ncbi:hypothetical protein E8E13_010489 [Curvularia kusanoi]|uniref:Amine oxidase domain-containing protein n=1 Tax=Curvularia kusanoi TaxID=90978 RepID=A0A9P4TIG5_CURKU|nr:hypothetical protein E8E13_010489 [Curvularia kusanoi]